MGVRAEHQRRFQCPRHCRNIIEIARRPGHVCDRAVVTDGRMHRAADAWQNLVHRASTRIASAKDVSS